MTSKAAKRHGDVRKDLTEATFARRLVFATLLFFAGTAAFNGFYTKIGFQDADRNRGYEAIINRTAARPYIYRQLVPATANLIDRLAPSSLRERLTRLRSDNGEGLYETLFSPPITRDSDNSFRYLVFYLMSFAGAPLAAFAFYLVCRTEGYSSEISLIAGSLVVLVIPYIQIRGGGNYEDFLEAAFIALAFVLARRAQWVWIVPLAFCGTLNKESFIIVLLALWPLLRDRTGALRALLQVFTLEFIAVGLYVFERMRFERNPGGTVQYHLGDQIAFFSCPSLWLLKFGKVYGIFLPELGTLGPALLVFWIVREAWGGFSLPIRRYAALTAAMTFPLFFLFCNPAETRDLSLLYVVLLLSIAATLVRFSSSQAAVVLDPPGPTERTELDLSEAARLESGVPR
ncbi:hypothetical protein DYQ86_27520 [Acidobacteria bacterium AB60]|nr:hypothetical protein DYQ86_27520 [Acidobacteria bacterium AB60]